MRHQHAHFLQRIQYIDLASLQVALMRLIRTSLLSRCAIEQMRRPSACNGKQVISTNCINSMSSQRELRYLFQDSRATILHYCASAVVGSSPGKLHKGKRFFVVFVGMCIFSSLVMSSFLLQSGSLYRKRKVYHGVDTFVSPIKLSSLSLEFCEPISKLLGASVDAFTL